MMDRRRALMAGGGKRLVLIGGGTVASTTSCSVAPPDTRFYEDGNYYTSGGKLQLVTPVSYSSSFYTRSTRCFSQKITEKYSKIHLEATATTTDVFCVYLYIIDQNSYSGTRIATASGDISLGHLTVTVELDIPDTAGEYYVAVSNCRYRDSGTATLNVTSLYLT